MNYLKHILNKDINSVVHKYLLPNKHQLYINIHNYLDDLKCKTFEIKYYLNIYGNVFGKISHSNNKGRYSWWSIND